MFKKNTHNIYLGINSFFVSGSSALFLGFLLNFPIKNWQSLIIVSSKTKNVATPKHALENKNALITFNFWATNPKKKNSLIQKNKELIFENIPAAYGPIKQPRPRNREIIPVAFVNLSRPTKSTKYTDVKQFIPAV